jgi:hypothetical protein
MITITRRLRSLSFFHKGTELNFDDVKISVNPDKAIGEVFNKDKSHLFEISFEKVEEQLGEAVVIITSSKHITEEFYSPWITSTSGGSVSTLEAWFYSFTSYFSTGHIGDCVPPINVTGHINSKHKLEFEVGQKYKVSLKQMEKSEYD